MGKFVVHSACKSYGKSKFRPITCHESTEGEQRSRCSLSLTSALDGGGWLMPLADLFTSGMTRYLLYGWVPEPVWTGAEKLALTGIG